MRLRHERAGGTYGPFHADVDVAWREATRLREQTPIDSLVHLRAAAFVVQEQVALYKDADLRILVRLGRTAKALAHARLRATPKERFDSLHGLISELRHVQPIPAVLVADTRQAAAMISDTPQRVSSLGYLVATLSTSNPSVIAEILDDMKEAVDPLVDDVHVPRRCARALSEREWVCPLFSTPIITHASSRHGASSLPSIRLPARLPGKSRSAPSMNSRVKVSKNRYSERGRLDCHRRRNRLHRSDERCAPARIRFPHRQGIMGRPPGRRVGTRRRSPTLARTDNST
jgi:hypothetical protein